MNLDEAKRKKVAEWIAQGLKLSEIQTRITSEFGITMTYMDVRFLVDDLKLTPKDVEPPKPSVLTSGGTAAPASPPAGRAAAGKAPPSPVAGKPAPTASPTGGVSVSVDALALPGAVVSGKVTFSDGNTAAWHLNQMGQLGLSPQQAGYRPPAADLQQFQAALEQELAKLGF
jgi:hypothetical protein